MKQYRRDDLRGSWICREAMTDEWVPCPDDPVVRYLDANVLPVLRREITIRYRGGLIRDVEFNAMTDPWGRLNPLISGSALITPVRNSRYAWARIEVSAILNQDGSMVHRGVTRAKDPLRPKPVRVRTYMRPRCDVTDDMTR